MSTDVNHEDKSGRWPRQKVIVVWAWVAAAALAIGMVIAGATSLLLAGTIAWVNVGTDQESFYTVPPSAYGAPMLVAGLVEVFVLLVLLATRIRVPSARAVDVDRDSATIEVE